MNAFIKPYLKYARFSGRADRKEFWYFVLFYLVVVAILWVLDMMLFGGGQIQSGVGGLSDSSSGLLVGVFWLASYIPFLAVAVRRLHDTGRSGFWVLLGLIPLIGMIILIVFYAQKGQPEANVHGAPPEGSRPA